VSRFTIFELKFAILATLPKNPSASGHQNKFTILGRPYQPGLLEHKLKVEFTDEERALAGKAFGELIGAGLVRPTYRDAIQPENWVEITEVGRQALELRALDDLDRKLGGPDLIEIRHGMWAALNSGQLDSQRQAAHSARELITKVLHKLAPNDDVKSSPGFKPDPRAESGITRKQRLTHILRKKQAVCSKEDIAILEGMCDVIEGLHTKLVGKAHAKPSAVGNDLKDLFQTIETALRRIL
jgi:hypothetical protein